ncbi:MAG: hypothetical protein KKC64_10455, partial [Spirochaetes bacterium]|nr:hypothetical protein [Spirochaetota bacterium]
MNTAMRFLQTLNTDYFQKEKIRHSQPSQLLIVLTLALSLSLLTACQPLDDSRSELNGGWSWAAAYAADSVEMAQNYRFEA